MELILFLIFIAILVGSWKIASAIRDAGRPIRTCATALEEIRNNQIEWLKEIWIALDDLKGSHASIAERWGKPVLDDIPPDMRTP